MKWSVSRDLVQGSIRGMRSPWKEPRLRHVVPAARLSETPAVWATPALPRGTHDLAWPSRAEPAARDRRAPPAHPGAGSEIRAGGGVST